MKDQVLIFGLGKQGEKYFHYFESQNYEIIGVNKTKISDLKVRKIYSFSEIVKKNKDFFKDFLYIVVSVYPYSEQNKVIKMLLSHELSNSIIIEKPVSTDMKLFEDLQKHDNIFYFLDEIYFAPIFVSTPILEHITICCGDNEFLEHALGFFLLRNDFDILLTQMNITKDDMNSDFESLNYQIFFGKHEITCKRGEYTLDNKFIGKHIFEKSLNFLVHKLCIYKEINKIYKTNFFTLQRYIDESR